MTVAGSWRPGALGAAALVAGAASGWTVTVFGELYGSEIVLPVVAALAFAFRAPRAPYGALHRAYVVAAVLMLVGYVLADLVAGTEPSRYLRGWARVATVLVSFISLAAIAARDRDALWWYGAGLAVGPLGRLVAEGASPLEPTAWKLGFAGPVAMLACVVAGRLPRPAAAGGIALLGLFNALHDNRALGVVLLLVAGATWALGVPRERRAALGLRLAVATAVCVAAGLYAVVATQSAFTERQAVSNAERFAALRIGLEAIAASPLVGYGSWGQGTEEYGRELYDATLASRLAAGDAGGDDAGPGFFTPHSQLLQAWIEGGVFAASLFVTLVVGFGWTLAHLATRAAGLLTPLTVYAVVQGSWDCFMSPFLGVHRLTIPLAMVLTACTVAARGPAEAAPAARARPATPRFPQLLRGPSAVPGQVTKPRSRVK